VDFERSEDQAALVEALRSLLDGRFDMAAVRGLETHGGVERDRGREPGDFGVFALGDDGMGWADAVLLFEQLGRALVPGRLVETALAELV
jgi:hypothetical protein